MDGIFVFIDHCFLLDFITMEGRSCGSGDTEVGNAKARVKLEREKNPDIGTREADLEL